MHYDAVFRREEGDPRSQLSREALTAKEHGFESTPPHAGQAGGSFGARETR